MARQHPFFTPAAHGFVRVGAATPVVHTADPVANADEHIALIAEAGEQGVDLLVFPELSLCGYAIDDLLMQDALLAETDRQLGRLAAATKDREVAVIVGAPVRHEERLYNCAVIMANGWVRGVVPKTFLPNYREYYEKRWFAPAAEELHDGAGVRVGGDLVGFGTRLLFHAENRPGFVFGVEICEDYWAPLPPSTRQAMAGARILTNLSASNVVIGKADERALLCASQSSRAVAAYVFAAAGWGESTTDLAWDGQASIHEMGACLASGARFSMESHLTIADVDVERIGLERLRTGTFADSARREVSTDDFVQVWFEAREPGESTDLVRPLDRFPFVPDDPARLDQDCYEAFNIQVQGLMRRMKATNGERIVIAVGRMSISAPVTPSAFISAQAFDFVPSEVANPGMVKPRMSERGFPRASKALAATMRAWVESRPPETPITKCLEPVACRRFTSPWTWMLKAS